MKINRVIYRLWHNQSDRGKIGYIGKDSRYPNRVNLERRRKDKGCFKLYTALNKYPLCFWKIEILAFGFKSMRSLNAAERRFIRKFNSTNLGYNITKGGEGGPGRPKGLPVSSKTKRILSEINSGPNHPKWGKKDSLETRKKKSKAAKGNKGNLGATFSSIHKRKIAQALKRKWRSYNSDQRKERGQQMSLGWQRSLRKRKGLVK